MVHIAHAGHHTLGDICAAQHHAALVIHLDNVPMLDAALLRLAGMEPAGLILIAILAPDFHGFHFPVPDDIVTLGMHPPSAVVGHTQQRIFLRPGAGQPLVMAFALLYPMWHRHTLGVIGGVFCDFRGVVFQLACGGGQGVILRVLIEVIQTRRNLIQLLLLFTGHYKDLSLLELLPGHIILTAGGFIEESNPVLLTHMVGIGVIILRTQLFCHLGANVKVRKALAHRRTAGMLQINGGKSAGGHIVAQIVHLVLGDHRENDIRKIAVILQPGMLRDYTLNRGVLVRPHGEVAVVPAGHLTGRIGPDHVDPTHTVSGVFHLFKLVLLGGLSIVVGIRLLRTRSTGVPAIPHDLQ